jgi:hypothetical protein
MLVDHDLRAIATELHANAVRIEGEDIARLVYAARAAHAVGLTVFLNPWKMNADLDETRTYLADAAAAAEKLRIDGIDIVLVAGCEYSIFSRGVFPGDTFEERVNWLGAQIQGSMPRTADALPEVLRNKSDKLNDTLRILAGAIRMHYKGPLTYAAGTWENVDWSIFDVVGIDYYRRGETEAVYRSGLDYYRQKAKPLAVMEVGCCTYEGAAQRGDGGFAILTGINPDGSVNWEAGTAPTRSENEQADYIEQQVQLLSAAGVDAIFVYLFSFPTFRLGNGASDLDMVSFALVKTFGLDDPRSKLMPPWKPKKAFYRLAAVYQRLAAAGQKI